MGEWQKKLGEEGERTAVKLMNILGWSNLQKGLDIKCLLNEKHRRKKTHGLDGLFSYNSPLHDRLLYHVCISVKYHDYDERNKKIVYGLPNKFKNHLSELDATLECFEVSDIRDETGKQWESGIDRDEFVGVLIWLHGNRDNKSNDDLISKFENIRTPRNVDLKHPIILIDQNRANFIFETHLYVNKAYPDHKITFNYHHTGNNNCDSGMRSDGEILPWELVSSGLLVYRAVKDKPDERILIINSIDKFNEEGFKRILSLAQKMSLNLANKVEICFPDYVMVRHKNIVNRVKSGFENINYTKSVTVKSYKMDLRDV
jgi:hypothetical protein